MQGFLVMNSLISCISQGAGANVPLEWGKLTDDEVTEAEGNIEELVFRIQEKYGESREAIAARRFS